MGPLMLIFQISPISFPDTLFSGPSLIQIGYKLDQRTFDYVFVRFRIFQGFSGRKIGSIWGQNRSFLKLIVQKSPVFPGTWHKWAFNDQANLIRENLKRSLSVRTSWYSMEEKHCLLFIPKTIKLIQSFKSIKDLSLKKAYCRQ